MGGTDAEACLIATIAKDTSGASSFIRPATDTTAYMDGSSGCIIFACDVAATLDHATSTPGASSSVCPVTDATIYADGSSGCIIFACDVTAVPDLATSTPSAPDALSSISSLVAITTAGGTSPDGAMAAPAPLLLASSATPADVWRVGRRARLFFSAILKGAPPRPTL